MAVFLIRYQPDASAGVQEQVASTAPSRRPIHANPPFHAPVVKSATLPNGLQVLVCIRRANAREYLRAAGGASQASWWTPAAKVALVTLLTVTTMARGTTTLRNQYPRWHGSGGRRSTRSSVKLGTWRASTFDVKSRRISIRPFDSGHSGPAPGLREKITVRESQRQQWSDAAAQGENDVGAVAQNVAALESSVRTTRSRASLRRKKASRTFSVKTLHSFSLRTGGSRITLPSSSPETWS